MIKKGIEERNKSVFTKEEYNNVAVKKVKEYRCFHDLMYVFWHDEYRGTATSVIACLRSNPAYKKRRFRFC
jgi:hypothetical protein